MVGDDELASSADLHALNAFIPSGDHLAESQLEGQRFSAVPRGIELATIAQGHSDVMHLDEVSGGGLGAVADRDVLDGEVVGGGIGQGHFGLAHDDNPTGSRLLG